MCRQLQPQLQQTRRPLAGLPAVVNERKAPEQLATHNRVAATTATTATTKPLGIRKQNAISSSDAPDIDNFRLDLPSARASPAARPSQHRYSTTASPHIAPRSTASQTFRKQASPTAGLAPHTNSNAFAHRKSTTMLAPQINFLSTAMTNCVSGAANLIAPEVAKTIGSMSSGNISALLTGSNNNTQQQQQQLSPTAAQLHPMAASMRKNSATPNLPLPSPHLTHRKSMIGVRLERPSFQAQRLSDVGIAVGQQLTAKMGFRLPASQERIVEQTRWLYLRYVFYKLRQHSLPMRDLNLTKSSRARRAAALAHSNATSGDSTGRFAAQETSSSSSPLSNSAPPTARILDCDAADSPRLPTASALRRKHTVIGAEIEASRRELSAKNLNNNNNNIRYTKPVAAMSSAANRKFAMDTTINNQIFAVIVKNIRELRELKPELYGDTIFELVGIDKFSSLDSLLEVQMTICQEMTRNEISWQRISALFSLFGAMSLDCVRLGAPEHVGPILDGFIGFVERDLAFWISQQGGWETFLYKHRPGYRLGRLNLASTLAIVIVVMFLWSLVSVFR